MGVKSPAQDPDSRIKSSVPVNEQDKAIIKEFKDAMDRGDERAALRAEAKYRRIDVKPEKNIYDYGPNDPDPTVDYYFEPLSTEEQAKFDQEDRREHGLTEEEIVGFSSMSRARKKRHVGPASAACRSRRSPQHPNPPQPARRQAQKPHHPQPLTSKSPLPLGEG